jgi:hypothetical protein
LRFGVVNSLLSGAVRKIGQGSACVLGLSFEMIPYNSVT